MVARYDSRISQTQCGSLLSRAREPRLHGGTRTDLGRPVKVEEVEAVAGSLQLSPTASKKPSVFLQLKVHSRGYELYVALQF